LNVWNDSLIGPTGSGEFNLWKGYTMASTKQEQAPGLSAYAIIRAFEANLDASLALSVAYEAAWHDADNNRSLRTVAQEVTAAGYPINKDTLSRYALAFNLTGYGMGHFTDAVNVVWPGEVKTAHGIIGRAIEAAKTAEVKKILATFEAAASAALHDIPRDVVINDEEALAKAFVTCLRALKACKKTKAPKVEDGPEDGPTVEDGPEDAPEAPEDVHPLDRGHALAQGLAGLAQGMMLELQSGAAELSPEDRTGLMASLADLSKEIKAA